MSGIKLAEAAKQKLQQIAKASSKKSNESEEKKAEKKPVIAMFKFNSKFTEIVEESVDFLSEDTTTPLRDVMQSLPKNEVRYIVGIVRYFADERERDSLVLIYYATEECSVRGKMIGSSSTAAIKKELSAFKYVELDNKTDIGEIVGKILGVGMKMDSIEGIKLKRVGADIVYDE